MEKCWFAEKHEGVSEDVLTCLNCERMKGKTTMDRPEDHELAIFIDGFRFAMIEAGLHLSVLNPPKEISDRLGAMDIRMKCMIDMGVTLERLQSIVHTATKNALIDLFREWREIDKKS